MSNAALYERAQKVVPGGVHSPVRAFKAVGGNPRYLISGQGPYVFDVEENRLVDYVGSFGPAILGHAHPQVLEATTCAIEKGLGFSAPHPLGVKTAEMLCGIFPSMDKVRFVNSGTEASQTAIRLARGATGRSGIIKFAGCYHGHVDALLVQAGSGALTLSQPDSAGIPAAVAADTHVVAFNDLPAVQACFEQKGQDIAAIIVEPVAGNMGCILPESGFLEGLRALCDQWGALLIMDEVMTGFRVAWGGAQLHYNVQPDLTVIGKVIGGGLPVGAVGGRAKYMAYLAPEGPVYQAGTLSGNPVTLAAGFATLSVLAEEDNAYGRLQQYGDALMGEAKALANKHSLPFSSVVIGGMMGLFFSEKAPSDLHQVQSSHIDYFPVFFQALAKAGIYWPPSAFEAAFIGLGHNDETLNQTLEAFDQGFLAVKERIK